MAENRLKATERKLLKDDELAKACQELIEDYLNKGCICELEQDESIPESEWYLPHFPVVKPDRTTSKGSSRIQRVRYL